MEDPGSAFHQETSLRWGFATAEEKSYDSAPVTPVFWLNQSNEFRL